jgi:hypothetical protein
MYARRQTRPKPRSAIPKKWSAPVAGWVSNRALADPKSIEGPGAAVLDNFFPKATGVALRRGKALYATFEDIGLPVISLFSYRNGTQEQLFGANVNTIYDLSAIPFPDAAELGTEDDDILETETGDVFGWSSTTGFSVADGYTGGDWSVVQFATTGGIYLIGVNGVDDGFIYDGDVFYPNVKGGVHRLGYDAKTADFTAGQTVTGGTSAATGVIWRVNDNGDGTGDLLLTDIVGTFQDDEALTDGAGGAATEDGVADVAAPGMDFGSLTSADMDFVWSYKNRLWFVQKDSLSTWYLAVDSIGGTATIFPMGGIFANGGYLMFGARWSLESGVSGGLSDQNIFVSSQGEVAIYQGISPDEAATWALVGVYRVGSPLGKKAYIRGGGDLAIATTVGLVPLSKAIALDVTALNVATVSYKIADGWTEAIAQRGNTNWQALVWAENKMAMIAPPDMIGSTFPVIFVSNTETGAWARFTGWQAQCMETFRGQLYFGSPDGKVFLANVGGLDDGAAYSGAVVPLFDDLGEPGAAKIGTVGRARTRSSAAISDRLDLLTDYKTFLPPAPDATLLTGTNTWDDGIWGASQWGNPVADFVGQEWRSTGGVGAALAPAYQVTSGSIAPIDVELIDMEILYTVAGLVT